MLGGALAERGHTVTTVALGPGPAANGLPVPVLGAGGLALDGLRALRSAARAHDVVVAHGSRTLPACALALAGVGTPFVYRNIGDPLYWSASALRRYRTKALLGRAAAVVALTGPAARALHERFGVPRDRLTTIPNAADCRSHSPADAERRAAARARFGFADDTPVVLAIGALSREKAVDDAVRAVAEVGGARLLVVGGGPERGAIEALAERELPGRAIFTGALEDPSAPFDAADVVVLSSLSEGLPGVLIEAGLRELPVAATDVGYVSELVIDGVTGVLVPPGDPRALADAVSVALRERRRLGAAARRRCLAEFELQPVADRWVDVLTRVASSAS